jgi:hypothetical protein
MANLAAIGQTHNIAWPIEPAETLKRAILREEKAGNEQDVKILTRAFESLTKIRSHFMTGE